MEQPSQIDANRLKAMLGGAKALMNKVESGNYEEGNVQMDTSVTGDQLVEGSGHQQQINQRPPQGIHPTNNPAPKIVNGKAQYKNMESSKMPSFIKEAMINAPMPAMSMNSTFTLDDVSDLVDKPMPTTMKNPPRPAQIQEQRQSVQQNSNDTFTVSETALRGIIKDIVKGELLDFMSETFAKQLSEQTIKKTINTLIKEGKIKTTTKKKPVRS